MPATAGDAGDVGSTPGWEDPPEEGMAATPGLLPAASHGQRSLGGSGPWGCRRVEHILLMIQQQIISCGTYKQITINLAA